MAALTLALPVKTNKTENAGFKAKSAGVINIMIKRGEIYFAQLNPGNRSEQGGLRPVLVVQNDIGNQYTYDNRAGHYLQINKAKLPTHVEYKSGNLWSGKRFRGAHRANQDH
jgi:hypothetical protein